MNDYVDGSAHLGADVGRREIDVGHHRHGLQTPQEMPGGIRVREGHSLAERQNTWSEALASGALAHYPVEVPVVGDALQLVLAGVLEGETGSRDEVLYRRRDEHL
jgi:hypothetical protein